MILLLQQQCAPLVLCRRLKELGAPQDSLHAWIWGAFKTVLSTDSADGAYSQITDMPDDYKGERVAIMDSYMRDDGHDGYCAAYTVAELGAMLNDANVRWDSGSHGWVRAEPARPWSGFFLEAGGLTRSSGSEAEARASLLIALIEGGIVKFEQMPEYGDETIRGSARDPNL